MNIKTLLELRNRKNELKLKENIVLRIQEKKISSKKIYYIEVLEDGLKIFSKEYKFKHSRINTKIKRIDNSLRDINKSAKIYLESEAYSKFKYLKASNTFLELLKLKRNHLESKVQEAA